MAELRDKKFRNELLLSIGILVVTLAAFFFVLEFIENRTGIVIEKGWMDRICPAKDLSDLIFPLTWPVAFIGVIICISDAKTTLLLIRTYALLIIIRGITLMTVPLDPPQGTIPLNDPLLHSTFYNGRANLKDLFFSGHVATVFMFSLILRNRTTKFIFLFISILLGTLIIIQRVHYITDVVFAFPFAWIAYSIAKKWNGLN